MWLQNIIGVSVLKVEKCVFKSDHHLLMPMFMSGSRGQCRNCTGNCVLQQHLKILSVILSSERFVHGPAWISFRCVSDLSVYDLWDKLASVAQSTDNFEIGDTLLVSCSIVSVPVGSGRVALTHESVFKRSILTIRNDNNLCLPRSLDYVKFLDSLNYLHMPLSAVPKAYGSTQIEKGTFPHLFNTPENQNYIGDLPPLSSYSPNTMSVIERKQFLEWYNDQNKHGYIFDFQKEIVKYCKQDVNIL